MSRQPLVDERVVGRQQIEHAAVLAHDALEEQLGLAPERLPQVVVEVREHDRFGTASCRLRRYSHCPAKLLTSASDRRIGQHPADLLLEHRRVLQLALAATSSSSSSGMLLHRKNDSRAGELQIAECDRRSREPRLRIALDAEHEFGVNQQPLQRDLDARPRTPLASRAALIEVEQRLRCPRRRRAAGTLAAPAS